MKLARALEFPEHQQHVLRQAKAREAAVVVFQFTAIGLMFLTMSGSQAMRTAWIEDILTLVPPAVFFISTRIRTRPANDRYPYGYHRVVTIAFLIAAVTLLGFGLLLLWEGASRLVTMEHPSIGTMRIGDWTLWRGWPMLVVLAYAGVIPPILGHLLARPAKELHDKVLKAGADMLKADWQSAMAAGVGVLGIGFGWWWLDGVAAVFISLSVIWDGFRNVRSVIGDLMDRVPEHVSDRKPHPLPKRIEKLLNDLDWVDVAEVRLRENGHVFFGEGFVVPRVDEWLPNLVEDAVEQVYGLDWRIQDFVIHLVPPDGIRRRTPEERSRRGADVGPQEELES